MEGVVRQLMGLDKCPNITKCPVGEWAEFYGGLVVVERGNVGTIKRLVSAQPGDPACLARERTLQG